MEAIAVNLGEWPTVTDEGTKSLWQCDCDEDMHGV
jgi:hypothetical protein